MRSRTNVVTILVLIAVLISIGAFAFKDRIGGGNIKDDESDIAQLQVSEELPYTDMNGISVDLNEYAGNSLIINAWASWSPFSMQELSDFAALKDEFGDAVIILAINRKEPKETAKAFIKHVGDPEGIIFLLDRDDTFYRSIGGFAMPETVFYDKEGNAIVHKRGSMSLEEMQKHANILLQSGDTVH